MLNEWKRITHKLNPNNQTSFDDYGTTFAYLARQKRERNTQEGTNNIKNKKRTNISNLIPLPSLTFFLWVSTFSTQGFILSLHVTNGLLAQPHGATKVDRSLMEKPQPLKKIYILVCKLANRNLCFPIIPQTQISQVPVPIISPAMLYITHHRFN